jgi:hypothetical protein
MTDKQCPLCGCPTFYVKDPDDAYEIYEFECVNGKVVFSSKGSRPEHPEIKEKTETFCNRCAWHGEYLELKNAR